jgi:hypothetical protein
MTSRAIDLNPKPKRAHQTKEVNVSKKEEI